MEIMQKYRKNCFLKCLRQYYLYWRKRERGRERELEGRKQFNHPRNGKLNYDIQPQEMFVVNKNDRNKTQANTNIKQVEKETFKIVSELKAADAQK